MQSILLFSYLKKVDSVLTSSTETELQSLKDKDSLDLLKTFLTANSSDSFLDLSDHINSQVIMSSLQHFIGQNGLYYVIFFDSRIYDFLTKTYTQPNTWFFRSLVDFIPVNNNNNKSSTTLDSLIQYISECPTVIRVATSDGLLLQNSFLIQHCRSIYYLSNEYIVNSRDVIDMMLRNGNKITLLSSLPLLN